MQSIGNWYKYQLSTINNEGGVERTGRKEGRKERRKEGKKAENLQTDEILCPLRLYKFPESRETFGFPLLDQRNNFFNLNFTLNSTF